MELTDFIFKAEMTGRTDVQSYSLYNIVYNFLVSFKVIRFFFFKDQISYSTFYRVKSGFEEVCGFCIKEDPQL